MDCFGYFLVGFIVGIAAYVFAGLKYTRTNMDQAPEGLVKGFSFVGGFIAWPLIGPVLVAYVVGEAVLKKLGKSMPEKADAGPKRRF